MAWAVCRRRSSRAWHPEHPATCSATLACAPASSSLSINAESSSSVGSVGTRGSPGMDVLPRKKFRVLLQPLLHLRACPGDPRLHGSEWHPQHARNLVVGHTVHVPKHDGNPHVVVERLDTFANQPVTLTGFGAFLRVGGDDAQAEARTFVVWHRAVSPVAPKVVITEIRGALE